MVWQEARTVRERYVDKASTEAVLMQAVIGSIFAGSKILNEALERLRDDGG
jgi:hypothetical protein